MISEALIVEDVRQSLTFLAQIVLRVYPDAKVTEAPNMRAALDWCDRRQFDLAMVDLNLPDGDGFAVLRRLTVTQEDVVAVVTTVMGTDASIVAALSAGAHGYLLKSDPEELIEQHLKQIAAGVPPLSPAIARRVMDHFRATGPNTDHMRDLTVREAEVLKLIARGLRVAEVADTLGLAPSTVSSHVKAIYRKLNISSRAEATYQATRMGLLDDGVRRRLGEP